MMLGWSHQPDKEPRIMRIALLALALMATPALAETPEQRLAAAGLTLPPPNAPIGLYVPAARVGKLLFLAGHGECPAGAAGKLGATMDTASGKANAAKVGLCVLATLKAQLGDLGRVKRVVSLNPYDYGETFGGGIRRSSSGWTSTLSNGGRTTPARKAGPAATKLAAISGWAGS
jgi:hypothetical protein